jgi:hypothetical protein
MADILLGASGTDVDERVAAKAALEAAEEQLQSLCKFCQHIQKEEGGTGPA